MNISVPESKGVFVNKVARLRSLCVTYYEETKQWWLIRVMEQPTFHNRYIEIQT